MRTVRRTPQARVDLNDIANYISERDSQAALRIIDAIEKSVARLAAVLGMGHCRPDVADSRYRFWNVKPFIIDHRFDDEALTVVRIVHGDGAPLAA